MSKCRERLNSQGGDWTLHSIDMALFSYYILREHKPEMLKDLPDETESVTNKGSNGQEQDPVEETPENGAVEETEPEPEKKEDNDSESEKSKSPGGEKRSLEEDDEDSNGSDSKRVREDAGNDDQEPSKNGVSSNGDDTVTNDGEDSLERAGDNVDQNGDTNSPHKANISGHLLVC